MSKESDNHHNSPFSQAWKRLKKNKVAVGSLFFLALVMLVALLGYGIAPDSTPDADYQILELQKKKPGFTYDALLVRKNKPVERKSFMGMEFFHTFLFGQEFPFDTRPISGYRIKDQFIYVQTLAEGYEVSYNLADVAFALGFNSSDVIYDGEKLTFKVVGGQKKTISLKDLIAKIKERHIVKRSFILGSDRLGRDYFSRMLLGIRVSISVGLVSVFISLLLGVSLGALAGYFRGWIDDAIMFIVNVTWSIPTLLLVFAIVLAVGRGFWQIFIAVGLTMWVEVARLVRGQVMSLREKEFIEAGSSLGFHDFRIIFIHILPNIMGPLIVIATANFAAAVLIEAGLSFLGIGVQSPTPSWGMMLKEHKNYITSPDKAFLAIIPGIAIAMMVYTINLLGNGLRDAFDVRGK